MALKLPRLQYSTALVDHSLVPSFAFQRWWDVTAQKIEDSEAEITSLLTDILIALSRMTDIPDETITADYLGVAESGQLPRVVTSQRYTGNTDDTANATWSYETVSGTCTASVTADGELTITAVSSNCVVKLISVYNSVTLFRIFNVNLDVAEPPIVAGGSATDTSLSNVTSATHAAISNELTVPIGSSGNADLSATLTVRPDTTVDGTYEVYGKWQWWDSAAWVDVAAEVASNPDASVTSGRRSPGTLVVTTQKTGLTVGTSHKFRLMARTASGTVTRNFNGTASVNSP